MVVVTAVLPVILLAFPTGLVDRSTLGYAPYSGTLLPEFNAVIGLVLLMLAVPAMVEVMT
ncbi:MAG: hypothetical protein R3C44_06170 [Chloroflexota bacterium]